MEVKDFTKEEQEQLMAKYANLAFANLKKNIIQDLINSRNESVIYKKYSKEQIVKMLENPQKNEQQIRELSGFIYLVSSHYRRLVDYYSTILLYNYAVVPTKVSAERVKKNEYKKSYYHVINECDKYNLKHEAMKAMKIAVRDGVYFGLCYETEDSFYVKPFSEYKFAKISSIEDGVYRFAIDLQYFSGKEYLLDMYGNDFKRAYEVYKGNKENGTQGDKTKRWYEPPNGLVIKADESDPIYSLPIFAGTLLSIMDIEDYRMLQKAKAEGDNYKILSAKLDVDENGAPLMDYDLASKYFQTASSTLPEGVGMILTPFAIQDYSFQTSSSADRNALTDSENNFWNTAGVAAGLFGGGNISSSSALLLSVKPDESLAYSMLLQFERFFNMKIKKMNLAYSFKISFSQQSIFNTDEYINRLSKSSQYAMPTKMQYASALGLSPMEAIGMGQLEETLSLADKTWNRPLVSSNVQSGSSESEGGRPSAKENGETIGDAGEQTQNIDANDNR